MSDELTTDEEKKYNKIFGLDILEEELQNKLKSPPQQSNTAKEDSATTEDDDNLNFNDLNDNISKLKLKIDKILEMVSKSGNFYMSIEKLIELIKNLKQQLKDTKCVECSNILKKVETGLEDLQLNLSKDTDFKENIEHIRDMIGDTSRFLASSTKEFGLRTQKKEVERLANDVISQKEINKKFGVTISDKNDDDKLQQMMEKVNQDITTEEIKLQEEFDKQIKTVNDENEKLNVSRVSIRDKAEIEGVTSQLLKDIQIRNIFKTLGKKIDRITTEINNINIINKQNTMSDVLLRKLFEPLSKLRIALENIQTYNEKIYDTNLSLDYKKMDQVKNFITVLNKFYTKLEKFDFKTTIPGIDFKYYNNILNIIDDFKNLSSTNITILDRQIKTNTQKLNKLISKSNNLQLGGGGKYSKIKRSIKIKKLKTVKSKKRIRNKTKSKKY